MADPISFNPNQGRGSKKNIVIIIVMALIAALVVGLFFLRKPQEEAQPEVIVVTQTPAPTPTTAPEIDKEEVKIQVLNGTGTPGQAGVAVDALVNAGYSADNIEAANAEEFTETATIISAREGFEETARDIKSALEEQFDEVEIDSSKLDESSDFDIVIVTGGKKFEEATPTAEPTTSEEVTPTDSADTTPTPTSTLTPTPSPT